MRTAAAAATANESRINLHLQSVSQSLSMAGALTAASGDIAAMVCLQSMTQSIQRIDEGTSDRTVPLYI